MKWFTDTHRLMPRPFFGLASAEVAEDAGALDQVDSLVLADRALPQDTRGRGVDAKAYYANIAAWVKRGGNLVLTDRALHALANLGVVPKAAISDIGVYAPFANFTDFEHPLAKGLRPNARQLVESPVLGYGISGIDEPRDDAPVTVVATDAWTKAGGKVVGTTTTVGTGEDPAVDKNLDDGTKTSIGELALGKGKIRIVGGALPTPTEENDHRYGLRNYAMTYTGVFLMENAIQHDAAGLGALRPGTDPYGAFADLKPAIRGRQSSRGCLSRRSMRITLRSLRAARSLRVTVGGKRVRTYSGRRLRRMRRGSRYVVPVSLAGRRAGQVVVRVTGRTRSGKRFATTRRYRLCARSKRQRS